jgi:hypothetical protein
VGLHRQRSGRRSGAPVDDRNGELDAVVAVAPVLMADR